MSFDIKNTNCSDGSKFHRVLSDARMMLDREHRGLNALESLLLGDLYYVTSPRHCEQMMRNVYSDDHHNSPEYRLGVVETINNIRHQAEIHRHYLDTLLNDYQHDTSLAEQVSGYDHEVERKRQQAELEKMQQQMKELQQKIEQQQKLVNE